MAERQKRRRFAAEFKAEAVKRLLEGGRGLSEVATELGLSPGQLSGGRNEYLAAGSAEALGQRKAEQAELQSRRPRVAVERPPGGPSRTAAGVAGFPRADPGHQPRLL